MGAMGAINRLMKNNEQLLEKRNKRKTIRKELVETNKNEN